MYYSTVAPMSALAAPLCRPAQESDFLCIPYVDMCPEYEQVVHELNIDLLLSPYGVDHIP